MYKKDQIKVKDDIAPLNVNIVTINLYKLNKETHCYLLEN